ncbi:glycosyltransferase family 1 protein [cf. Phormidesmis sp. LEGE 11477]|uniref:glycosyltransferase family 4 protein n=1 Tax=cf. Phormidesmis sp. LEGE 11477 TaxID=1828680 RepID=UPI001882F225|nr:glycosyltransferase family 1 protein [cf. Phormidesmis sp. LEGE 11477]MBE9061250.1 glycosyltransferase family 4 protein [cf. Phormidesmis sp. LEGE 11477]
MHVLIPALHRPTRPTGVCRHAANLALCLASRDRIHRVTLIIGRWQQGYFERTFDLSSEKITVVPVDIKNSSASRNYWFLQGLPKVAKALSPDIIHLSFPFPFIRKWFNAPVVSTIHDLYPYEYPQNFGYPRVLFNQAFLQQCVRGSDGLVCVSKETLESLETYFSRVKSQKQTTVIYNVVDFSGISPQMPSSVAEDLSKSFLLTVAQHRQNKNLDLLIRVYATLCDNHTLSNETKLVIVGSTGPETENLQTLVANLGVQDRVLFLSGLEDSELRWLYEQAELFVIPSSTEGFCLPLAEALSLGCPAVCSDIPVFREVGLSSCRYFKLDEQAAHTLAEVMTDELNIGRPSTAIADSRFLKQTVSKRLLDFYMQLAVDQ